ncbi:Lrp/AsnC family transcriptional regulator [Trueperella sp. LYQ143]|uniref:Lrp/AsnC family transcriptional regulator n=1 Tax=unclassified Trueperella TaxID=2630174 RepID=UPI00398367EE
MISAIVMIDVDVHHIPEVAQAVASIEHVQQVYSVTGDVDLIAVVSADHHEDLARIIPDGIAKVGGVRNVRTYLAFQEFSRADLDAAYDIGLD